MHRICSAATRRGDRATNQDQYVLVDGATAWPHTCQGSEPRDRGRYAPALGAAFTNPVSSAISAASGSPGRSTG
ncbi:hypothetical protein Asi03nite_25830 [Actinoplanes siamensis]|uniref:Uncharacterized protein n=1 Tax=Actinoplanes siamensis TaxID=1223317 RepID=A0A919N625_9ACTN|nr:hypothetical protein Asi03nite_25830 [Actinoplanes siamensis]